MHKRYFKHHYCTYSKMELIIAVVLGVIVSFLAFYLTKGLKMTDEQQERELQ